MVKTRINIHMDNFDDHAKDILKDVYENTLNCDIILRVGKRKFSAHKAVLAFASDFLKEIIEENSAILPGDTVLVIPDVDAEIVEQILTFIYTGEARMKEESFMEFVNVCNVLKLKSMINYEYVKYMVAEQEEVQQAMEEDHSYMENVTIIDDYAEIVKSVTQEESTQETDMIYENSMQDGNNYEIEVIEHPDAMHEVSPTTLKKKRIKNETNIREGDPLYKETLQNAMQDIIYNKVSFKAAAEKYNMSKTVLWRTCQQSPEYQLQKENTASQELNQTILEELKNGETLLGISKKYNIPVSTLHRRKSMLFEKGELPENVRIKQRNRGEDFAIRLEQAIMEVEKGVSQTEAAKKYRIPKTTIWRRLKRNTGNSKFANVSNIKIENIKSEDAYEIKIVDSIDAEEMCMEDPEQTVDVPQQFATSHTENIQIISSENTDSARNS